MPKVCLPHKRSTSGSSSDTRIPATRLYRSWAPRQFFWAAYTRRQVRPRCTPHSIKAYSTGCHWTRCWCSAPKVPIRCTADSSSRLLPARRRLTSMGNVLWRLEPQSLVLRRVQRFCLRFPDVSARRGVAGRHGHSAHRCRPRSAGDENPVVLGQTNVRSTGNKTQDDHQALHDLACNAAHRLIGQIALRHLTSCHTHMSYPHMCATPR